MDRWKKIGRALASVPGAIELYPILAASLVRTFFPGALTLNGVTGAVFSGSATEAIVGMMLLMAGSQLAAKDTLTALKRGGVLSIGRILIGVACCVILKNVLGLDAIWGISIVTVAICMVGLNPGGYIAVCYEYGDEIDLPAFGIINIVAMPFVPLLILGAVNGNDFDYMSIVSTMIPFLLGMLLGNISAFLKDVFNKATNGVLFFAGIQFGSAIDWKQAFASGREGLIMIGLYFLISIPLMLFVDKVILRRPGYAAMSMMAVPGTGLIMPGIIAASMPQYAPVVRESVAQIALAVAVTTLLSMWFTKLTIRKWGSAKTAAQTK